VASHHRVDVHGVSVNGDWVVHQWLRVRRRDGRGRGHGRIAAMIDDGGVGCETPGVYFVLCREFCPKLGCSVEISISRSCLSPFIKLLMKVSPNLELFNLKNNQIWSVLKLLSLEENVNSKVNLVSQILSRLICLYSQQLLFGLCPNLISRHSSYVPLFNPNLHSPAESLLCQSLINSYANRLVISMSSFISIYQVYSKYFLKG
jgi:hypothetical protein